MTDSELVRLAAEKVMGWRVEFGHMGVGTEGMLDFHRPNMCLEHYWPNCSGGGGRGQGWNPLASDADCWGMVDKMHADGWGIRVALRATSGGADGECGVRVYRYEPFLESKAEHSDRRRAIVIACLRAVGVQVD